MKKGICHSRESGNLAKRREIPAFAGMTGKSRFAAALALLLPLAGCAPPSAGPELADLYGRAEILYRTEAKFRTEYDPIDAPIDAQALERNFLKLAFNSEEQVIGDRTIVAGDSVQLLRWSDDVTYASVGITPQDAGHLDALAGRIGSVIGRSVIATEDLASADVKVWMLDGRDRRALRQTVAERFGESLGAFIVAWTERPELPCIGMLSTDPEDDSLAVGLIFVKAELSGNFRRACLTEEFTQVFGLINDDPEARPSIFNDDQEFIELTRHDEYLLKVLYDPRLRAGMTEAEARPLVHRIVQDIPGLSRAANY